MPDHASQLYARNIQALLELITDEGALKIDPGDEIVKGAMVSGSAH
jgi:NAD(P) transhydrogenase subunit alpha